MSKGKSGSGSMAALQEGRKGEMGQVSRGGGPAGASTPTNSSSIGNKFHDRPGGGEISLIVNKGDGLSK
ncbi:hypothetical protein [Paraburkholderia sp. BL10I2N1]|uniref:hypothetical protein n=1 Tax=Paraburkholderia sp. BL10I2N1 TaxID=1938796 RepID=UPI0010623503|nr:hypothetical protein [Paraburkholderia sp. BL10I2N1]TDN70418.1 hypothetical protein B0G77_3892 [Paraburkholderia sp. BL10I2N1]